MADEMKKNLENEELDLDALENVSGGLVVDCGRFRNARVVDDKTGKVLKTEWYKKDAKKQAVSLNVSDKIISLEEYKKIFGKDLDLDDMP